MTDDIVVYGYNTSGRPIGNFLSIGKSKPAKRQRKPSLASAIKQAGKAGVNVAGATVKPDGSVALEFGETPTSQEDNEWDDVK